MSRRFAPHAGLEDTKLTHPPGKALVSHPLIQKVDVTGGTAAGRAIGAIAGSNLSSYTAELGGKAPVIVLDKANVPAAVNGIAFGSFVASGQTCVAATRIIVHASLLDAVLSQLATKARSIERRMGSPANPASTMGPLVSAAQLARVEDLVDAALADGVTCVTGGKRLTRASALDADHTDLSKGHYYPPTILTSSPSADVTRARIWRAEAFGPVICVVPFDDEPDALRLANDSEFGLGAAVWTQDLAQAMRVSERVEAGICWVNTHHRNDPSSPWGGVKSASGVGSENGVDAYRAYTKVRSTVVNFASVDEALEGEDWFRDADADADADGGAVGEVRYG